MLSADVFVLAARRESFGLVLIEARAAGCAIVATNADGVAEALEGGRAGVLVPPQDVAELGHALCNMLGDDEECTAWRQRAVNGIDKFTVDRMAREVGEIYRELMERKKWRGVSDVAWTK